MSLQEVVMAYIVDVTKQHIKAQISFLSEPSRPVILYWEVAEHTQRSVYQVGRVMNSLAKKGLIGLNHHALRVSSYACYLSTDLYPDLVKEVMKEFSESKESEFSIGMNLLSDYNFQDIRVFAQRWLSDSEVVFNQDVQFSDKGN